MSDFKLPIRVFCPDCNGFMGFADTEEEAEEAIETRADHHGEEFCRRRREGKDAPTAEVVQSDKEPSPKPAKKRKAKKPKKGQGALK